MGDFVHLHLHSEYSLLDGACRIDEIASRAAECGQDAVAVTDHGVMYGVVDFYQACKKAGIKPILGCEVYVAPTSRFDKGPGVPMPNHLVLLCENQIGYRNLMYMVSKGFTEGFYAKPRVDKELLRERHEGLIALSACLSGKIARLLSAGKFDAAVAEAREMSDIFGENNYFIELQNHGLEEQKSILPELVRLAGECGLPTVVTNDCHYLRREDAEKQKVLACIQMNKDVTDEDVGFPTNEFYFKTGTEMRMLFGKYQEGIDNTLAIAARCNVELDFSTQYLPKFPCPHGKTASEYLREEAMRGMHEKENCGILSYQEGYTKEDYLARAEYELKVIGQMGYDDYFLIVADYVGFAKKSGIPVGPGRGSGAGSLIAFLLSITEVDPLRFNLLFERFLNPERVSMPDIDVDFCYNRRDEVIQYVTEKYGADHVCQIITFGTLAARAAVRDVGRVMGLPYADVDAIAKLISQNPPQTIRQALLVPEFKQKVDADARLRHLVDTAASLEGMPRNVSIHAAGVVITDRPLTDFVPLSTSHETVITQFDMDTVAHLGLLKFDFLALRYLTVLHDAEEQIREADPDFSLSALPLDDKDTYALISKGDTGGVFQLESEGIRQMLVSLSPSRIDDILAAIALYRPGPMDSIPRYIECRKDPSKIRYATPLLEPVLRDTYGCAVYQEQVMSIFSTLAGYTYGHADIVRRAMSKKKADALEAERIGFIEGCAKNGIEKDVATKLFDDMAGFANYAFNKLHAAAYALISYRTAYCKAHFPREYLAAMLTSELSNPAKIAYYIGECAKRSISVLPPDVNKSSMYFHVSGGNIRFGLLALRNVGEGFITSLLRERERGGDFLSFEDFVERMAGFDLNKRQVESMIRAGVFDSLGVFRSRLLVSYEEIIDRTAGKNRANVTGQLDMFSSIPEMRSHIFSYPEIPELGLHDLLQGEKEVSGMYFSGHPIESFSQHVATLEHTPIADLLEQSESDQGEETRVRVRTVGVFSAVRVRLTKKEEKMATATLEDRFASIECVIFPKAFRRTEAIVAADRAVLVSGSLSLQEDEEPRIMVEEILPLIPNEQFKPNAETPKTNAVPKEEPIRSGNVQKLFLRVPDLCGEVYRKTLNLLEIFDDGKVPVIFYDTSSGQYQQEIRNATVDAFVLGELVAVLGKENVVPKYDTAEARK